MKLALRLSIGVEVKHLSQIGCLDRGKDAAFHPFALFLPELKARFKSGGKLSSQLNLAQRDFQGPMHMHDHADTKPKG